MVTVMVALALAVVLIVLLAVPVVVVVDLEWAGALRGGVQVRWMFGLVDVASGRMRDERPPQHRPPTQRGEGTRRRSRSSHRPTRMALAALRTDGFARRGARLVVDLMRRVQRENVRLRVAFGFDDPADTGPMFGVVAPWLLATGPAGVDVRCIPDFTGAGFAASFGGTFRVSPLAIIAVLVAFVCSAPTLRAAIAVWRAR